MEFVKFIRFVKFVEFIKLIKFVKFEVHGQFELFIIAERRILGKVASQAF